MGVLRTKTRWLVLAAAACLLSAVPAKSQEAPAHPASSDDRVVLSVGDAHLTAAEVSKILANLPAQHRAFYEGPGREQLAKFLVRMKVLVAESEKRRLEDDPEVKWLLQLTRESVLANEARKRIQQETPVSEPELEALYAQRKSEFEEVRLRRLLIRTPTSILGAESGLTAPPLPMEEARAKITALREQIVAGEDFAGLAQAESEDLMTAGKGGDMGYVNRLQVVPPVAEAAFSLSVGEVSQVIETPYGLELIKLEDKRTKSLPEVRALLEAQIQQQRLEERLQSIEKQYKVVIDEKFFGSQAKEHSHSGQNPAQ